MGTVTRTTKILVALAVVVLVGGIVALWAEWRSSALPDDDTLAARVLGSEPIMVNGWEFRLLDILPESVKLPPFGSDSSPEIEGIPPDSLIRWEIRSDDIFVLDGTPLMVATPVSPMAKLRFWFGAYSGRWEPTRP